jgi:hypothetical protein
VATADGVAQLVGDHPGAGEAQGAALRRRGRDQPVEAILLDAIEVEMSGDGARSPGGVAERRHPLFRPGHRQPVIQPVGTPTASIS